MIITNKIKSIQEQKKLSLKRLAKLINYSHGGLSKMINAKAAFPKKLIKKLLPVLEVSKEEFESWLIADKYSKEVLELAIKNKKVFPYKRKSMFTIKLDNLLQGKGISRTTLSKEIGYNQSSLNAVIVRKRSLSKSVLEKLSKFFDIPEDEILSWIVADKYSLSVLELAYSYHSNSE